MNLTATATNGERLKGERLKFRIGVDDREATEFTANDTEFHSRLCDALIEHGASRKKTDGGKRPYVFPQVWTTDSAKWRNIQRCESGNVVAIYFDVSAQPETSAEIYRLACNSVQMARDCDQIAAGLAGESP